MSDVVIASNTSLKVNRAISGATTVNANCYAVVTYNPNSSAVNSSAAAGPGLCNVYFGPGQTIPSTITTTVSSGTDTTFSLFRGVEFINSP
jgi:Flp pilus assembly protein TadG